MNHDDLTCERFLHLLGDLVDGAVAPAQARACERHLEACADCRRYRADYETAMRMARDALGVDGTDERFPDDLARSILSRIRRSN